MRIKKYSAVPKIHLKKSSNSSTEWTISNKPSLSAVNGDYTAKNKLSKNGKRKNEEFVSPETKKQKKDFWSVELKKILETFNSLKIEIDIEKIGLKVGSYDEKKAILHNNYAIYLIENLNETEKNYSTLEKIKSLNKAITLLMESEQLYKKANLVAEKNNIALCKIIINKILENLKTGFKQEFEPNNSSVTNERGFYSDQFSQVFFKPFSPVAPETHTDQNLKLVRSSN